MSPAHAKELLLLHSFSHPDLDHPKMAGGFMGSLRPYRGLNEENYREVMEAIRVLAPQFQANAVDRQIVNALWGICYLARLWALEPGGMLQRNNLMRAEEISLLSEWGDRIGWAVMMLLDNGDVHAAFDGYESRQWG